MTGDIWEVAAQRQLTAFWHMLEPGTAISIMHVNTHGRGKSHRYPCLQGRCWVPAQALMQQHAHTGPDAQACQPARGVLTHAAMRGGTRHQCWTASPGLQLSTRDRASETSCGAPDAHSPT